MPGRLQNVDSKTDWLNPGLPAGSENRQRSLSRCDRAVRMARMVVISPLLIALSLLAFPGTARGQEESTLAQLQPGQAMPEFELTGFRGKEWSSAELADGKVLVVLFLGTECPLVRLYASRLNEIQNQFEDDSVQLVGINSNLQDSIAEIGAFARDTGIEFPLLKDPGNRAADAFGAQRTPEAFVFDQDQKLVYRGRIDDQYTYGRQRPEVINEYVVDAINAILKKEKIETATTDPVGCHIGRSTKIVADANAEITYHEHIRAILQDKCIQCHRDGEIGPFSLTEYSEVAGWADMIQEVINEGRMPPWHANPEHGTFQNDIRLSDEQITLINRWVDEGVAEGDPEKSPAEIEFTEGWQIGEPDVVIPMSADAYRVPATGIVEYQYFVADTGFEDDRWIEAAEIRIGNRAVVHHVIVALDQRSRRSAVHGNVESEWLAACAPGSPPMQMPEGYAKLVPRGSKIVFQMHYTPNGTAAEDITSIGLKFADPDSVKRIVSTRQVLNERFRIPAHAENHEVSARYRFREDSVILALFPHMHLRGKAFRYTARYPDGSEEILLDIPGYDFNWQNVYILEEPKTVPRGTVFQCVAAFDNSENNIANPDPTQTVRWGDQTFEEMMIGYFDSAPANQDLSSESTRADEALNNMEADSFADVKQKLFELAPGCLESTRKMNRLGVNLRRTFPQLDRVGMTLVIEDQLIVKRVSQIGNFTSLCGGVGVAAPVAECRLPALIDAGNPIATARLSEHSGADFEHMAKAAKSSFHVPIEATVRTGGLSGSINFWSADENAFPAGVVGFLEQLVVEMQK